VSGHAKSDWDKVFVDAKKEGVVRLFMKISSSTCNPSWLAAMLESVLL
jgi:hypothetical protein